MNTVHNPETNNEDKPVDIQTLAESLNGIEYPVRIDESLLAAAKAHGLVIVYGASDDLMEFGGAINDEVGCFDGGTVHVDAKGVLPERDNIDDDDELKDFFAREPAAKAIEAVWDAEGYSWVYRTDIPHATFDVREDADGYCRGIVFSLADLNVEGEAG